MNNILCSEIIHFNLQIGREYILKVPRILAKKSSAWLVLAEQTAGIYGRQRAARKGLVDNASDGKILSQIWKARMSQGNIVMVFFFLIYFIYLSLDALDLCCWAQVFSSCSGQGFLLAVHMPHFAEHGL